MGVTVSPNLGGRIGETAGHLTSQTTGQSVQSGDSPDRPDVDWLRERCEKHNSGADTASATAVAAAITRRVRPGPRFCVRPG
jgi:hypothetical protein